MLGQERDLIINKDTQTKQDYEVLQQLEKFFKNSIGTTNVKIVNFTKYIRSRDIANFLARYELFKKIQNIQGAIIECGILYGGGLMSWAHFSTIFEPLVHSRKVIGFDTFSGFPEITEEDKAESQFAKKGGMAVDSYQDLKNCIEIFDSQRFIQHIPKIELIKGDVAETVPKYIEDNSHLVVSLLYLDLDIYKPTKIALENFFPRMPKGAVIAFDELNSKKWPGETKALLDTISIRDFKIEKFNFNNYKSYIVLD